MIARLSNDRQTNDTAEEALHLALECGLSFKVSMGNVLTLSAPLIVTESHMHEALDILDERIRIAEGRPEPGPTAPGPTSVR